MSFLQWSEFDKLRVVEVPFDVLYDVDLDMIISQDTSFAYKGNTIVSWNGKSSFNVLKGMLELIPHSNIHSIRSIIPQLLVMEPYLRYLGLVNDNNEVPISIINDNPGRPVLFTYSLPLINITNNGTDNQPVINQHYYIPQHTAVLTLRSTQWTDEIHYGMISFIQNVGLNGITKVVIDVRDNVGGSPVTASVLMSLLWKWDFVNYGLQVRNASCFDQFFPGINETDLMDFLVMRSIDISGKIWDIPGDVMMDLIKLKYNISERAFPFLGGMYIVIGPNTLESANLVAKIVKDTRIGGTIGTPTGFTWNFYGLPVKLGFEDEEDYYYTVSTAKFYSPNALLSTIVPDVLLPMTKDDIVNSNDPLLQYVFSN